MAARRPQPITLAVVIGVVAFGGCTFFGSPGFARLVSDLATVAITVVAAVACALRGRSSAGESSAGESSAGKSGAGQSSAGQSSAGQGSASRSRARRVRWAWSLIGLGALSYAFGEGAGAWFEVIRDVPNPSPGLSDVGYLGMVPLVMAGLLTIPVSRQAAANRVRSVVDGLMIAVSLLLVSWLFVIQPLVAEGSDSTLGLAVLLAYPVSDVLLVTVVIYQLARLRRGRHDTAPLTLLGAGILLLGISDTIYVYASLRDGYASGDVLDTGWYAGFSLMVLAAHRRYRATPAPADAEESRPIAILIPYAAVVGALIAGVVWYAQRGHGDPVYGWCRNVLIVLIVGRQLLTLLENRQLTGHLEARVRSRTTELYASEQRFRALVSQSSDSVAVIDPESTVRYQSDSVEQIFGWRPADLIGRRLTDISGEAAAPRLREAIASIMGEPLAVTVLVLPVRHRDGRVRLAEMTMTNLLDDPTVNGLVLNTRDVHDAQELQDQLMWEAYHDGLTGLASRALFRERLEESLGRGGEGGVAILFLDLDDFKEVNDSLGHAAGDELLTQVADRIRRSVRDGDPIARFGGDEFAVLIEAASAPSSDAAASYGSGSDAIAHPASASDAAAFSTSASDAAAHPASASDIAAWPAGASNSAATSHALVSPAASSGADVSGGVSAAGPGLARSDAKAVAERIVAAIGEPFVIDGRELHVGASIGLACADDATGIEQLLRNADLAMYKAKEAGGHGYASYDPQMHDALVDRLALEADLRVALERDELVLHYQPTVDLRTGEIIGFEALVRWAHPSRGIVSPLDFIGIAETTGLIVPLGRWVLAEACRQAVAWGPRISKMAVNVSVRQFDHGDLAEMVASVLAETGMPAARLCLEMTESVLLTDTDENLAQLQRIKALGVTLAMDDFGTGYSSLAYLRRFPMDTLKIDRSFVDRLGADPADAALVQTIIDLGQSLGLSTVAEGIEEPAQLQALKAMGCDYAQGFYMSRPVPAAEAERLLHEGLTTLAPA